MLPILKALKDRLLNEPAFFIQSATAAGTLVATLVALPFWVAPVAIFLGGIATRAVVSPAR